jgi:hypothetical protein
MRGRNEEIDMESTPEPIAVAIKVAHRLIGISRSKFYQELAAGEFRTIKCGRRRLVLVQSVKDYVHRREAVGVRVA